MKKRFKNITKNILIGTILVVILGSSSTAFGWKYEVKKGDTFWKLSERYNVSIDELMKSNNATENTVIYVGQKLNIPDNSTDNEKFFYYMVKSGDTPWLISKKFDVSLKHLLKINNLNYNSIIHIGEKFKIPNVNEELPIPEQPDSYVTYTTHEIKAGDNFWDLSIKYGVPYNELLKVNDANSSTLLQVGQQIKAPVHHVPVMETLGPEYGEYLDWWKGARYVIPRGTVFKVIDFYTGKSFIAKRTTGANHADVETLTASDTSIMKSIWGGNFNWQKRPIIIEYNNRRIAASASGMPHAGNDKVVGGKYSSWRSGGYDGGLNHDYVKGNNMNGHFDIHFLKSTRHVDGEIDDKHKKNIKISSGLID